MPIELNSLISRGDYVVNPKKLPDVFGAINNTIDGIIDRLDTVESDIDALQTSNVDLGNWIFIKSLADLPAPVGNIISLGAGTYVIAGTVDLMGNRLVFTAKATLLGGSSETSYLKSTGLTVGQPLITTTYTLAMQFVTICDVDTGIDINGTSNLIALDWTGVNFENVPNVGVINTSDNWVYTKGAFLDAKNLVFKGVHGTLAINNSLLRGDGLVGDIIKLDSTVTIVRRFRTVFSSIIAFGSTNGINVDAGAIMNNEAFILDTVNFSGSNQTQYLPNVNHVDNRSLFLKCTGIVNTANISSYSMENNATVTTIGNIIDAFKIAGTTTSNAVTQKFINTNNKAKYIGSLKGYASVTAVMSATAGNNNQLEFYIAKNGNIILDSRSRITANGSGRAEQAVCQAYIELTFNDEIEVYVKNNSLTNVTVTELSVKINFV